MMIYQQAMLTTTFAPINVTSSSSSPSSSRRLKHRSVNFSSCTKKGGSNSQEEEEGSHQQRAGVKRRSSTISVPIPNAMFRSPSELQLTVDEQVADERDYNFFSRLVSGISERSFHATPATAAPTTASCCHHYNTETDRCLTHIIQTRQQMIEGGQEEEEGDCSVCGNTIHPNKYGYHMVGGVTIEAQEDIDQDWFTASCSSSSSSSTYYQQDFDDHDDDHHQYEGGDNECIFDLEL